MTNDSKYGRLYPERAVAPLREMLKMLVEDGLVTDTIAFAIGDALDSSDSLGFPPDEPLFVLRGQDTIAPDTVRHYAEMAAARDAPLVRERADHEHILACADRMEAWEPRKLPD